MRSEIRGDAKSLNEAQSSLEAARTALKAFQKTSSVRGDAKLSGELRELRRRLKRGSQRMKDVAKSWGRIATAATDE